MTIPNGGVRVDLPTLRPQSADDQLGIRVEADREVTAADATADDQGAASGELEPAPTVASRQRTAGAQDRSAIGKCDLAAMCVSGESDIESLVGQE